MRYIDNFLNKITMYKLVLYGLCVLAAIAILFGFFHVIDYSGMSLVLSLLTIVIVCYITNFIFARIVKVPMNSESYFITALILFLILFPIASANDFWMYLVAGTLAMGSKYIFAWKKKHIFNPAAITLLILGAFGSGLAAWWVGSFAMVVPTAILGFLVLRKVKRFQMFFIFATVATIVTFIVGIHQGISGSELLNSTFVSGPLIFFGTIMLTEPLTTPPQRRLQWGYGVVVGILYGVQFHLGPFFSSPEMALVLGNIYSYIVSPRARLLLALRGKSQLSSDVYEFIWDIKDRKDNWFQFKPGQYLEWTLGHDGADMRGNRRYFTIASSPTEEGLRLGVKFYPNGSSFKNKLVSLEAGDTIIASQLSGEFVLPQDLSRKLVWIAGGIGVTPFRAMTKYMLDKEEHRDIVFFFSNKTVHDIVYKDLFDLAREKLGMKTTYVVNDEVGSERLPEAHVGMINSEMIARVVPDYKDRMFYISGTHGMVTAFQDQLQKIGIPRKNIIIDFFPGFV